MHARTGRRLAATLAGTALALTGALPAMAGTTPSAETAVHAEKLTLNPGNRGYQGDMTVTVTNTGTTAGDFYLRILEPIGASFRHIGPGDPCFYQGFSDNRRIIDCYPSYFQLQPGQSGQATLSFEALTTVRPYPMRADQGTIQVLASGQTEAAGRTSFGTLLRSPDGSVRHPRPYVQDAQPRASVTAGDATFTRRPDGSWWGRVPVSVRYAGDAAHDELWVNGIDLPAGVTVWSTDPESNPADWVGRVPVPGGRFMAGEQRNFDLVLRAADGTAPGDLGTATVAVGTRWSPIDEVADADPSDNTVTVRLAAAG